jgi:hypothetical protein
VKKKKIKLRERIKNRPKTRIRSKTKKKTPAEGPKIDGMDRPAAKPADEGQGLQVMSQVILDFAKPLLETCNDRESERKALSLAIFVWNATLLSEEEQKKTLDNYLSDCKKSLPMEAANTLSSYIDLLVESKKARFTADRRKITNCTFGDYADNSHIEVGYILE